MAAGFQIKGQLLPVCRQDVIAVFAAVGKHQCRRFLKWQSHVDQQFPAGDRSGVGALPGMESDFVVAAFLYVHLPHRPLPHRVVVAAADGVEPHNLCRVRRHAR